jgi:ABC-type lipoprotein release transport system permease subunit
MGLLAAMPAVTGVFGMAAYKASRRIKELGISSLTQIGMPGLGFACVTADLRPPALLDVSASRLLAQAAYQVNPRDPVVVDGVVLTMALLGRAASALPALRAIAVDPSKLLREE